ncbi:MAG: (Fe-S)-binding protein [Candidatus Tectimicrobiota bacterium]
MTDTLTVCAHLSPLQDELQHAKTSCIQCGFCLPKCPTYRLTGREVDSPRGRIDLMQAVAAGELTPAEMAPHLDFCLGCRACETACPAGVEYGKLLEAGRAETLESAPGARLRAWIQRWCWQALLPSPDLLQHLTGLLYAYQVSGLQSLVRASGLLPRLAPALAAMEQLLPEVPSAVARRPLPACTPALGEERGTVALLTGCIMPVLLPQVHQASARVLTRNGYTVLVPPAQRCCGALPAHAGDLAQARRLARQNIAAFEVSGAEWIVVNAAGCGALMKEYGHLLRYDPVFAGRAAALSQRVCDISELLARAPLRGPLQPVPLRVAYDDPCHLQHGQHIQQPPRDLLRQVPQLALLDVPDNEWCCGSAGIYNLLHPETARALLEHKLTQLLCVQPQLLVTGNPGCILQLRQGLRQQHLDLEVLHPVEVLDRAYAPGSPVRSGL